MSTANTTKIYLGALVVFNTHPYVIENPSTEPEQTTPSQSLPSIIIKNGDNADSPVMVVAEIIRHYKTIHDENTGDPKTEKNHADCKCIWYNGKSGQFEETWLSSRQLTEVRCSYSNSEDKIKQHSVVYLKSLPIEKAKLNRTFEKNIKQTSFDTYRDRGLHTFEPPIMQVLEVRENNRTENMYDSKTGEQKKVTSTYKAKCKWFNTSLNKFSENWLPVEVLTPRKSYNASLIQSVKDAIGNRRFLRSETSLLVPSDIVNDGFRCQVSGFDIISGKPANIEITEDQKIEILSKYFIDFTTGITGLEKEDKQEEICKNLIETINTSRDNEKAIKIIYTNLKGETLSRVITNYKIESGLLTGYCNLRNAERNFTISRIRMIEIIDFPY